VEKGDAKRNLKKGKEGFRMEEGQIKTNGSRFLRGLLIGGVLGGIAGLLFAPKTGKELRADLKERGSTVFKGASEVYSEARTQAKAIVEDAKRRAEELKREADRQLREARLKASQILAGSAGKETIGKDEARGQSSV